MEPLTPHCDHTSGCITCGDEAVAMEVLRIDRERGLALCADGDGAHSTVETALVEPVREGESLLVHAGTAIGRDSGRGVAA
jgi:hydrogenase maturation factor